MQFLNSSLNALQNLFLVGAINDSEKWFEQIKPNFWVSFCPPPADQMGFVTVDFIKDKSPAEGASWGLPGIVYELGSHVVKLGGVI
jgi:hypothetical protein